MLTVLHIVVWLIFATIMYGMDSTNLAYEFLPIASMLASTLVVIFAGVIYHISTEVTYEKLQHTNAQKEILLKEIHQRIKNNLNKMSSSLGLQMLRIHQGHYEPPEEILRKNKLRIEATSLVHEALYKSEDISSVEAGEYIHKVVALIAKSYNHTTPVAIHAEPLTLPIEIILKIGIIINELYTNSIKYIDKTNQELQLEISLFESSETCTLIYTQAGHIEEISITQLTQSSGLGMMLVRLLVEEMGGNLEIRSSGQSLVFTIFFTS